MLGDSAIDLETLDAIKRRYTGKDLGPADCPKIVAEVIAEDFGVAPNSIFIWAKRYGWQRPAWYKARRCRHDRKRSRAEIRAELLAALQRLAAPVGAEGASPCPTNLELARAIRCSTALVVQELRALRRRRLITIERSGPRRRITIAGARTGWTNAIVGAAKLRALGLDDKANAVRRHSLRQTKGHELAQLLRAAAAGGKPCPTNHEIAAELRVHPDTAGHLLCRLAQDGELFRLERRTMGRPRTAQRRVVFADGAATAWPAVRKPAGIDLSVIAATLALRRRGKTTFDTGVLSGRWGERWCVDGKLLDRQGLLQEVAGEQQAAGAAGAQRRSAGSLHGATEARP